MTSTDETPQGIDTTQMANTERQTPRGKVLWHFTMSLDGFVAGPNHAMDWMTGISIRPGLVEEYAETTGAQLLSRLAPICVFLGPFRSSDSSRVSAHRPRA